MKTVSIEDSVNIMIDKTNKRALPTWLVNEYQAYLEKTEEALSRFGLKLIIQDKR